MRVSPVMSPFGMFRFVSPMMAEDFLLQMGVSTGMKGCLEKSQESHLISKTQDPTKDISHPFFDFVNLV